MMGCDSAWDQDAAPGGQVAGGGLEEEEGLFGDRVFELLDVVRIVAPYGDYLVCCVSGWYFVAGTRH